MHMSTEGLTLIIYIQEGRIYDSPESVKSIASFVETYKLDLSELLVTDLSQYGSFNEFFYRCAPDV